MAPLYMHLLLFDKGRSHYIPPINVSYFICIVYAKLQSIVEKLKNPVGLHQFPCKQHLERKEHLLQFCSGFHLEICFIILKMSFLA